MNTLISINPSNYQIINSVNISTDQEIKDKVDLAKKAFKTWSRLDLSKRLEYISKIIEIALKNKDDLGFIQSQEMGMPLKDAIFDVEDACGYIRWYIDNAPKYLEPETTFEDDKSKHTVYHEPIGVGAVILPWNFPWSNVVWGTMQSMIAGNTVVVKHSEECPLTAQFIEKIIKDSGLADGVFNMIYGSAAEGQTLLSCDVNYLSFTGSTKTGKLLFEQAGKKFIKSNMELGGSAPAILFKDANLNLAVESVCTNRLFNQGQCCDGLKRLIVHEDVYDEVLAKLIEVFKSKRIGNATDSEIDFGPLVSKKQLATLVEQVKDAVLKGAKIETGGNSLEEKLGGAFFEPTILTGVNENMRVMSEEVFGPVLPIVKFKDVDQAVTIANNTTYGLGAYIYTKNAELAEDIASKLESGMVSINGESYIKPFNPFGGYKSSGIGREHGKYGFLDITKVKVIATPK